MKETPKLKLSLTFGNSLQSSEFNGILTDYSPVYFIDKT
jgi:hypothetical protein